MLDRQIAGRFLKLLDNIEYGTARITLPDGMTFSFQGTRPGAAAEMQVHDWRVFGAMLHSGDIGLAETYRDGWWDAEDPAQVFLFGLENQSVLDGYISGSLLGRLVARFSYFLNRNTLQGSRKNIHAHYDLGNDFYALWLDSGMTYSSAIFDGHERNFDGHEESLTQAQYRKYDRILERLKPSGSLLEVGCGWGAFAERALAKGDYDIKGLTISQQQHHYATQRLAGNANIALEDYRHQQGRYDQIVSIEMFEAVGEQFWPVYFGKLKSLLARGGSAVVQTITVEDDYFESYRNGTDAIRTFIFPGGMLPSVRRFREESAKAGLQVTDQFSFGQSYATTLQHWLKNFDARLDDVRAMGFDEKFIRLWRFYLTGCIATFQHGRTNVVQVELQHAL